MCTCAPREPLAPLPIVTSPPTANIRSRMPVSPMRPRHSFDTAKLIKCPTLVLYGGCDRLTSNKTQLQLWQIQAVLGGIVSRTIAPRWLKSGGLIYVAIPRVAA